MKNRALSSAIGIAFALAACSHMDMAGGGVAGGGSGNRASLACDGTNLCKIDVTVTGCAPGGTQVGVNHTEVGVRKGKRDVDIHWNLQGNDYEFPERPIIFKSGASQFTPQGGNKNTYKVRDANTVGGRFEYSITVVKKGGAPCTTKDPIIINDYDR